MSVAALLSGMGYAASAHAQEKQGPVLLAAADKPLKPSDPNVLPDGRVWYGKQIITPVLVADGLTLITFVATIRADNADLQLLGYPILMARSAVGPIVHWAHGHILRGFGSLALNTVMPFVGVAGAVALTDTCGDDEPYRCFGKGLALGIMTGMIGGIAATAIETSLFAYDDPKPNTTARAPSFTLSVIPTFAPKQVGIAFGGQF